MALPRVPLWGLVRFRAQERVQRGEPLRPPHRTADGTEIDPGDGEAAFTIEPQNFTIRSLRANAVLRWEWRPGSTLYLVWQQNRESDEAFGNLRLGRDLDAVFTGGESRNVLAVKASYWLSW